MILVRTEMHCKWGRVNEVVDRFKAMSAMLNDQNVIKRSRILTDLSGRFDTVIIESEIESMDDYFAFLQAAFANPDFQPGGNDDPPYEMGSRDYYTIEATYEVGQ